MSPAPCFLVAGISARQEYAVWNIGNYLQIFDIQSVFQVLELQYSAVGPDGVYEGLS